jgi:hypothetical protein
VIEKRGLEKAERFVVDLKEPVRARFLKAHGVRSKRGRDAAWVTEVQAYEAAGASRRR